MVDVTHLLSRLDEAPGGAVSADEIDALILWAREDKRQVDQIVAACELDMARLHQLYKVVEQRCRREPVPGAAMLGALRAIQPLVADRPSAAARTESAAAATAATEAEASARHATAGATLAEAEATTGSPSARAPEPATESVPNRRAPEAAALGPPPSFDEDVRAWLAEWLSLPPEFIGRLTAARTMRIFSRACAPAPQDVDVRDIGHLAVMCHLLERRRDTNLARCLDVADLRGLDALVGTGEDRLHRLRVAVTRPEVRAMLHPDDLPDFAAFLALFSDLDAVLDRTGPEVIELGHHIAQSLGLLIRIDQDVRQAAAALVSVAHDLALPRDVAMRFWGTHITLGPVRLPVDDLPLTPEETARAGMVASMLLGAPDAEAHEALLDTVLSRHRIEAAFMDALMLLLGRGTHPESRRRLRAALGLPEDACDQSAIEALLLARDATAASVALRELPDHHPAKVLLYCRTAWLLWKAGATRDAEALATRAMRIAPREALPLQSLARLRLEMGQYPQAQLLLNAALRASPDDPVTARMLVELHKRDQAARPR